MERGQSRQWTVTWRPLQTSPKRIHEQGVCSSQTLHCQALVILQHLLCNALLRLNQKTALSKAKYTKSQNQREDNKSNKSREWFLCEFPICLNMTIVAMLYGAEIRLQLINGEWWLTKYNRYCGSKPIMRKAQIKNGAKD